MPRSARIGLALWTGLVLACLTVPLAAQHPTTAQQNAIRQNCRADFQARCSGVPTGGSAAVGCLQQNAASVSAPCQQALSAISGGNSGNAHPAQATPPSGSSVTAPSGISVPPEQAAPSAPLSRRQRAYILRQACGADFQKNCHGVPLGGGHAIACLASHRDVLSRGCQGALASARQ
jgi:hypothetical protein